MVENITLTKPVRNQLQDKLRKDIKEISKLLGCDAQLARGVLQALPQAWEQHQLRPRGQQPSLQHDQEHPPRSEQETLRPLLQPDHL